MDVVQMFKRAQLIFKYFPDQPGFGRVDHAVPHVLQDRSATLLEETQSMNQTNAAIHQMLLIRNQEIIVCASN
jgi:hypothetical protein